MSEYTDYQSAKDSNRKGFEQNYSADVQFFEAANAKLSSIWERLGTTRDKYRPLACRTAALCEYSAEALHLWVRKYRHIPKLS